MDKPIIGILGRIEIAKEDKVIGFEKSYVSKEDVEAIEISGGIPIILPVLLKEDNLYQQIKMINGLLVPGGGDINPLIFGEEPIEKQGFVFEEIDNFDIKAIHIADKLDIPILGICRGMQIINVAFGGTLYQDLSDIKGCYVKHDQEARRDFSNHTITIKTGTILYTLIGNNTVTNSYHHQAIKDVAHDFTVCAMAKDGVIEAIEKEDTSHFVMGVQWHPEMMINSHNEMFKIFRFFIEEALVHKKTSPA